MEKIKLLLYCTKSKPYLVSYNNTNEHWYLLRENEKKPFPHLNSYNGKIVAECDFEVEEIETYYNNQIYKGCRVHTIKTYNISKLLELSCLNQKQLDDYLGENNGYAIHIKNLNIFDKPKELSEYGTETSPIFMKPIAYAPQNMMRCIDVYDNQYILISIRPEYLVRILNKEKTIECRKRILKEMIK